jgi:hypothetical protein
MLPSINRVLGVITRTEGISPSKTIMHTRGIQTKPSTVNHSQTHATNIIRERV